MGSQIRIKTYIWGSHKTQYFLGDAEKVTSEHKFQILPSNKTLLFWSVSLPPTPSSFVSLQYCVFQHNSPILTPPPASPGSDGACNPAIESVYY